MDAIVLKALVKDPDYRYQSADEMRQDIEACLDGQPVAATAAMGSVGYGGYPDDQATTALRSTDTQATSMLPPMNPDDGGYGYNSYDDRPDRRRQQKKSNTSTILLIVAGVLVLVGAILIGKWMFGGSGVSNNSVTVPNLVSQTQKDATQLATNAELKVSITKKPCENEKRATSATRTPKAGVKATKGDTINLVVSTGAPKVVVPGVTGQSLDDAKAKLTSSAYNFTIKTQTQVSTRNPNTVLDQDPKLGAEVQKGFDGSPSPSPRPPRRPRSRTSPASRARRPRPR